MHLPPNPRSMSIHPLNLTLIIVNSGLGGAYGNSAVTMEAVTTIHNVQTEIRTIGDKGGWIRMCWTTISREAAVHVPGCGARKVL